MPLAFHHLAPAPIAPEPALRRWWNAKRIPPYAPLISAAEPAAVAEYAARLSKYCVFPLRGKAWVPAERRVVAECTTTGRRQFVAAAIEAAQDARKRRQHPVQPPDPGPKRPRDQPRDQLFEADDVEHAREVVAQHHQPEFAAHLRQPAHKEVAIDRKSTRLNSS